MYSRFLNLILIFVIFSSCLCYISCETNKKSLKNEKGNLQRGRTRRMIWLDKRRRLILPPDTSLSVTPILAFPLFKETATWVSFENFQLQWTFFILFQGLGWTSNDNAWPMDLSFFFKNMTSDNENSTPPPAEGPSRLGRNDFCVRNKKTKKCEKEKIPVMSLPPRTPGGERASLFPNLEAFLESLGISGRACLKRVVCEVHEIPLKDGFGLLGEFLTMLFSVSESTYAHSHLPEYLRAELAGKYGDCSEFHEKCPYSIFTSKI